MQAINEIFQTIWPSVRLLADDIGEKCDTVRRWKKKGRIPQRAWTPLIQKAAEHGYLITVAQLYEASRETPRGRPVLKPRRKSERQLRAVG